MEKKIDFDSALKRLEEITEELEKGNLTLDQSLKFFEEGIKLSRYCESKLMDVENKIKTLESMDMVEYNIEDKKNIESNKVNEAIEIKEEKEEKREKKKKKESDEEKLLF